MRQLSYGDFLRLLEIHLPVRIHEAHIAIAEEEKYNRPPLVEIAEYYSTIETRLTGGYTLPTMFPASPFRKRLIHEGLKTPGFWGGQTWMIDEMIGNARDHGNQFAIGKKMYLLWHQCGQGKEIYVVDEGNAEFDLEESLEERRKVPTGYGKHDVSGIDLLRSNSKEFEYFSIVGAVLTKKGTLLRIVLEHERPAETKVECAYLGHQLFAKPAS